MNNTVNHYIVKSIIICNILYSLYFFLWKTFLDKKVQRNELGWILETEKRKDKELQLYEDMKSFIRWERISPESFPTAICHFGPKRYNKEPGYLLSLCLCVCVWAGFWGFVCACVWGVSLCVCVCDKCILMFVLLLELITLATGHCPLTTHFFTALSFSSSRSWCSLRINCVSKHYASKQFFAAVAYTWKLKQFCS